MSFAERVIDFNRHLAYDGPALPNGIRAMNPFREDEQVMEISSQFYRKYYNDNNKRHLILGINPGRFGGALTGVPFTDPKRLQSECGIHYEGKLTHEPSSVFIYEMIAAFGGPDAFYRDLYIHSLFPLGLTITDNKGREKNYNYYDSPDLCATVTPAIVDNVQKQIALGCYTDVCFCFGTGKNENFIQKLNATHRFFDKVIPLEHPRFIMQYRSESKQAFINKYLEAFAGVR